MCTQRSNCNDLWMPPLRKSISLAAPCGPSLSGHLENGALARAGKRSVSEYWPKRRRLPLREVPGLLCPRGARAKSVHRHLPSMPCLVAPRLQIDVTAHYVRHLQQNLKEVRQLRARAQDLAGEASCVRSLAAVHTTVAADSICRRAVVPL